VVRYVDDTVMGFELRADAERFVQDLGERLRKFGLELNRDKTRLIEFGRAVERNRKQRGERKPETFDFLGFTHICGKTRNRGYFMVLRKTSSKRMRAKLQQIKRLLLARRHDPVSQTGEWLQSVVQGYFNYHAVPGNVSSMGQFREQVSKILAIGAAAPLAKESNDLGSFPPSCSALASCAARPPSLSS
jgi:hypothetical protein